MGSRILQFLGAPGLLLAYVSLFWAGNTVVARAIIHDITPFTVNFWRWVLAVLLLLLFSHRHVARDWRHFFSSWRYLFVMGVLGVSVYSATLYLAVHTTGATNAAVIGSTTPVFSAIASWFILRQGISGRETVGFFIALAGIMVIFSRGDPGVFLEFRFFIGDFLMAFGIACFAVYSVLLKRAPLGMHPLSLLTAVMAFGLLGIAPFYAWEVAEGAPLMVNWAGFLAIVYGAVFMSLLAYVFFNRAVAVIGANKANLYGYLAPPMTAVLVFAFLDEAFETYHLLGMVLTIVGVHHATWRTARPQAEPL